jgi:NADH-quinone oxidoreductase subunit I
MIDYCRDIVSGLWTLLVGMKLTLKYALSPTITTHYPFETLEITPNFRGHTDLVINAKTGKDKCIVCMMCQRNCPSQCITVGGEKPEGSKKRVLTEYQLDFTKCSLCGNCVEVCPTSALEYSDEYQLAGYSRHDFHYDLVDRFRARARAMGVEPKIADLTPVPEKPKPEREGSEGAAKRKRPASKSDEGQQPKDSGKKEEPDAPSGE